MAEGFADPSNAARMREVVQRIALQTIDEVRPDYRYGTVTQIDGDLGRAMVQLSGDTSPIPVKILGVQPVETGQVVQVAGHKGDRFISGIVGQAVATGVPSTDLPGPANFTLGSNLESVVGNWDSVPGAASYELQIAEDAQFSVNARSFITQATQFTANNLVIDQTYYGRARALNSSGDAGAWSTVDSAVAEDFPSSSSDGIAPSASPDAIVSNGLGFLLVEWLPISNQDPVTYEVHISETSGFTPEATTLAGTTTDASFFFINDLPNGDPLVYGTTYFVRIVATDPDGAAIPGAQDFGSPRKVELGDVGNIPSKEISDGDPPTSSPDVDGVTNGVGFLVARWTHISNPDGQVYEVHISTTTDFTPDANTLLGETYGNTFFVRSQGAGAGFADLAYGTTYYIKIWAKDNDGYAPSPGLQGSGFTVRVTGVDITDDSVTATHMVAGTITAASGIIADAAIGTAKIQDAAINNAKIASLAVGTAEIQDLAVGTAKIANAAISTAKIGNLQVTNAKINDLNVNKLTAGSLQVGSYIRSTSYSAGSSGWEIKADGSVEFNNAVIRGVVDMRNSVGDGIYISDANTSMIQFYASGGSNYARIEYDNSTGRLNVDAFTGLAANLHLIGDYVQIESVFAPAHFNDQGFDSIGPAYLMSTLEVDGNAVFNGDVIIGLGESVRFEDAATMIYKKTDATDWLMFRNFSADKMALGSGSFIPAANRGLDLGASTYRWDTGYIYNLIQGSDARDKRIHRDAPGLEFIKKLHPVIYNWTNVDEERASHAHYGLVAQEVAEVLTPGEDGMVSFDEDGVANGLAYAQFIAPLIAAVQELSAELDLLKRPATS